MIAPADPAAALAFATASAAYAAMLAPGHIGRLDLALLTAELAARGGRPPEASSANARQGWRATMGREAPTHITPLH